MSSQPGNVFFTKKRVSFITLSFFGFIWTLVAITQAVAQEQKSFLWSVSDSSGPRLYLFGDVVMLEDDPYPLTPAFYEAFINSSELLVIQPPYPDFDDRDEQISTLGFYSGTDTIWEHLDVETRYLLRSSIVKVSLDESIIKKMRPWYLNSLLYWKRLEQMGYGNKEFINISFLLELAILQDLPIRVYWTDSELLNFSASFSEIEEAMWLKQTLLDFDSLGIKMESLYDAWKKGDIQAFESVVFDTYQKDPELSRVLRQFDQKWADKFYRLLQPHLDPGRLPFVVVNAMLLVGEDGLLKAFSEAGYMIEQL